MYRIDITLHGTARDGTPKTSTVYYCGDGQGPSAWTAKLPTTACVFARRKTAERCLANLDLSPRGNLFREGKVVACEVLMANTNDIDTIWTRG